METKDDDILNELLNDLEQPEVTPAVADNVKDGSKLLGKFTNVDELCRAYENLHADYTRKSQTLAKIQQGHACVAVEKIPVVEQMSFLPKEEVQDDSAKEREKIIEDYLVSVARGKVAPKVISAAGDVCIGTKPNAPSMGDAVRIVEMLFKQKEKIK
jgi:hypothetical protein